MSYFLKCECPHCGQPIEYPSEGTGETVPCPTCQKPVTLTSTNPLPAFVAEKSEKPKRGKVTFSKLTEETIKARTKSGDTPLHRAAKIGKIYEIPKYLLRTELFLIQNWDSQGKLHRTPLHVAAMYGHLDQVPLEFLTIETLAVSDKYGKTPLHEAAGSGYIHKVPVELLTPENVSIPEKLYGNTMLHYLALRNQLSMLPSNCLTPEALSLKNYDGETAQHIFESINGQRPISAVLNRNLSLAPSETEKWRAIAKSGKLLDTLGLSHRRKVDLLNQLIEEERGRLNSESPRPRGVPFGNLRFLESQRRRLIWDLARPIRLTLPIQKDIHSKLLPAFTDESLRAVEINSTDWTETYIVNLLDYTCTCQECVKIHSGIPPRDVGRICKHIIIALRDKNLVAQLPPIARGIVENGYPEAFGIHPGRFANDLDGNPIYITGQNEKGWVSVFALKRRGGVNYYRFGYNVNGKRWWCDNERGMLFWRLPKIDESILY